MPPVFNFRGYCSRDPLDKAPVAMQYALVMIITAALSVLLVYLITDVFRLLEFRSFTVKIMEVLLFTFIFAPVITALRKSSSLVLILIILIPLFKFDIYLQANFRDKGMISLWTYLPGTFIDSVKILPLRFLMTLTFDALIFGPLCLWLARVAALILYKNRSVKETPTKEQQENLFTKEWTEETVDKPQRDAGYWILRLLGISYLAYLLILFLGMSGASPWPESISNLIEMTYRNPAMAVNTFSKIGIMILLTFTGAYNRNIRYYCVWGLITGHAVSTVSSLAFYFYDPPGTDYRDFLMTSAIVDGVMILLFIYILIKSKADKLDIKEEKDFPKYFSIPSQLAGIVYFVIAGVSVLIALFAVYMRLFTDGESGLQAVFGYPDPTLGNTLTLYITTAYLSVLLGYSEKLRHYLFGVLLFPFFTATIITVPLFIFKDIFGEFLIQTRSGGLVEVNWYFIIFIVFNILIFTILVSLRKMYYNVDYIVSSMNPSSAKNVIALAGSFYGEDSKRNSQTLQMIDQYIGGIRGRKRGILNFPFWIVENVLNIIFGLHPNFSVMSRDEQRWFLKKYLFRSPAECMKSFIPDIALFGNQTGIAVNAMVMFANYSNINERSKIGYIPPDARDRLQGDAPMFEAPFRNVSPLPKDEKDEANNKPSLPVTSQPQIAPRVSTPVSEAEIPDEADYIIIGSGAGGAVMSYRLACEVKDASRILVIERGSRYQPLQDFNNYEMEMMRKLYKEGGLQQTKKFTMSVLQGECVGGTTVVNNSVCIEMTKETRKTWEEKYDIDLSGIDNEYNRIAAELEIKELGIEGINHRVMERFKKGVAGYNGSSEEKLNSIYPLKANYRNILGDENWNLGNKRLRKRSMLETYIPWSEARGVKVIPNQTALKFVMNGNRAEYVILRSDNGDLKKVKINKALIVAGGVISSSHFLMRSGLEGNTGKNMSCNFAFPVTLEFEEEINAFDGNQITLGALDVKNRAVFETYFNPPASFSLACVPFYFNRREAIMNKYSRLINYGALVGSEPNGIIQKKADIINGQAFTWELGGRDSENIKYALNAILKLGMHSGAVKAVLPTKPGLEIPLSENSIKLFSEKIKDYPLRMEDLLIGTAHPQGGNIMTGNKSESKEKRVVDQDFKVSGLANVYVSDASIFPESMGLNPQWTIFAMSSMASRKVIEDME